MTSEEGPSGPIVDVIMTWSSGMGEYLGDRGEEHISVNQSALWTLITQGRRETDEEGSSFVSTVTIWCERPDMPAMLRPVE